MDRGYIKGKPFLQFVTGINGAIGACPESVYMMKETADQVIGTGNYEFSAFGAGKMEYPCCMQSLLLGGHVRVGMEDNLFLGKGRLAKSNAELVEKMAHLMQTMDYEIATPAEAREILGPHLVTQLGGGAGGFRGLNEHLAPATKVWLEDMAKWTEYPLEYSDQAEVGIAEEMKNREPGTGNTDAELGQYLSKGIMTILKYHGKL